MITDINYDNLLTQCKVAKSKIVKLMEGNVVNAPLSKPMRAGDDTAWQFEEAYAGFMQSISYRSSISACYWPGLVVPAFVVLLSSKQGFLGNVMLFSVTALYISLFCFYLDQVYGYSYPAALAIEFFSKGETKRINHLANRYRYVSRQADHSMQGIMPLFYPHTFWNFTRLKQMPYLMQHAINQGLLSMDHNAYDCVSASALCILELISRGLHKNYKIERFYRNSKTRKDTHSFVVVNRYCGNSDNILSWNDDALLLCPWYNVCLSAKEFRDDAALQSKYFLLCPVNCAVDDINPKEAVLPQYQSALEVYLKKSSVNLASGPECTL